MATGPLHLKLGHPDAHEWIPSTLGHGIKMCKNCHITDSEAAAIGALNSCSRAAAPKPSDYRTDLTGMDPLNPETLWRLGVESKTTPQDNANILATHDRIVAMRQMYAFEKIATLLERFSDLVTKADDLD